MKEQSQGNPTKDAVTLTVAIGGTEFENLSGANTKPEGKRPGRRRRVRADLIASL